MTNSKTANKIKYEAQEELVTWVKKYFPYPTQPRVTGLSSAPHTSFWGLTMSISANLVDWEVMTLQCKRVKLLLYVAQFPFDQSCSRILYMPNLAGKRWLMQIQHSCCPQKLKGYGQATLNHLLKKRHKYVWSKESPDFMECHRLAFL